MKKLYLNGSSLGSVNIEKKQRQMGLRGSCLRKEEKRVRELLTISDEQRGF